jgi:hypothetical protein
MKKIILVFVTTLIITGIWACSKEKQVTQEPISISGIPKSDLISNDINYIDYLADAKIFFGKKKDINEIKRLMKLETLTDADKNAFARAMGFSSKEEFESFGLLQNKRIHILDLKYGLKRNAEKNVVEFVQSSLERKVTKSSPTNKLSSSEEDDSGDDGNQCGRKYANCLTIATAVGVGAHIACLSVDWATAGVGFYVCHGAATLLQTAMTDDCIIAYNACNKIP